MLQVNELKAEFVRNNMTQKQVAKAIGISEQTLRRRFKTGIFGTDEIQKLTELLNLENPQYIFFGR